MGQEHFMLLEKVKLSAPRPSTLSNPWVIEELERYCQVRVGVTQKGTTYELVFRVHSSQCSRSAFGHL